MSCFANKAAGRVRVGASNIAAIREARKMFNEETRKSNDPDIIAARKSFYKDVLAAHAEHQGIVAHFRL